MSNNYVKIIITPVKLPKPIATCRIYS